MEMGFYEVVSSLYSVVDFHFTFTVRTSALLLDSRTCNGADDVWRNGSRVFSNVRS